MKAEKIIELLMSGEEELVKQLLIDNPDLVPEVVQLIANTKKEWIGFVGLFGLVHMRYQIGNRGKQVWLSLNTSYDILKKINFFSNCPDYLLATTHNIEAFIRAWVEERELEYEDFDWSPLDFFFHKNNNPK